MNRSWIRSLGTAFAVAIVVNVVAVVVIAPTRPRVAGPPALSEERLQHFGGATSVAVDNADGWVRVRTHSEPEVTVRVALRLYVVGSPSEAEVRAYADLLSQSTIVGGELRVSGEPKERPDWAVTSIDYDVAVPERGNVAIRSTNGNVTVMPGCGEVFVEGGNSDVEVLDPVGEVRVDVATGRIRVVNVQAGATLRTVNGNVYVHATGGRLLATTTNGAIVARLLGDVSQECKLSAQNGGVTAILRDGYATRIDAYSERGAVKCDVPVDATGGVLSRRTVKGRVLGGDTVLSAKTLNGDIWITRSGS